MLSCGNDFLHGGHGGGQQRGNADDGDVGVFCRLNKFFNRNVDAEINDLVAARFDHHNDKVLADVVQVSVNGTHDHFADLSIVLAAEMGLEHVNALLHRAGSDKHFRNENLVLLELFADNAHGVDHAVIEYIERCVTFVEAFLYQIGNQLGLAVFTAADSSSILDIIISPWLKK